MFRRLRSRPTCDPATSAPGYGADHFTLVPGRNGTTTEPECLFTRLIYEVLTRTMALASCLQRTPATGLLRPTVLMSSSATLARLTCIKTRLHQDRLCGALSVTGSSFRRPHARGRPLWRTCNTTTPCVLPGAHFQAPTALLRRRRKPVG